jgi:hypothetical protein
VPEPLGGDGWFPLKAGGQIRSLRHTQPLLPTPMSPMCHNSRCIARILLSGQDPSRLRKAAWFGLHEGQPIMSDLDGDEGQ